MDLTHEAGEEEDVQVYERSYTYDMENVGLLEKGATGRAGGAPARSAGSPRPRATPPREAEYEPYADAYPPDSMEDGSEEPGFSEYGVSREVEEEQRVTAQLQLAKARRERLEAEAELRAYDEGGL